MTTFEPNTATKTFTENSSGGLMICGINWGGNPDEEQDNDPPSFFSDKKVNNYRYRNTLLRWFELWGHPLETEKGKEEIFERSIIQTNWIPTQSYSMKDKNIFSECLKHKDSFLRHLQALQPRLLVLCSKELILALNCDQCLPEVEQILGPAKEMHLKQNDIHPEGKKLKRFVVGFQSFERCEVVAFPHPSGSRVNDQYIASFADEMGPLLAKYKKDIA